MARSHSLDDLSGRTRAALPASRSRGGTGVTVQEIIEEDEVVEMHDDQYGMWHRRCACTRVSSCFPNIDGVVRGRTSRRLISNGEAAYGDEDFVELVGDDDDVTGWRNLKHAFHPSIIVHMYLVHCISDPTYAPNKAQVTKTIRASAARQAGARAAQRAVYQPGWCVLCVHVSVDIQISNRHCSVQAVPCTRDTGRSTPDA
jgi:hypothetical protein